MNSQLHATQFNPIGLSYAELYNLLRLKREQEPVFYWEQYDCWVFNRYDDIVAILKDKRFSNEGSLQVMNNSYCSEAQKILERGINWNETLQVNGAEGETHARLRKVMLSILTPQRFRRMEPTVRQIVTRLIDGFATLGHCDIATQFCYPLPIEVIFDVIGFVTEEEDLTSLQTWSDDMSRLWLVPMSEADQVRCAHNAVRFQQYMREKISDRRRHPRKDLLTEFVKQLDAGGSTLSEDELILMFPMDLITAGHETIKGQLTNAFYQLLIEPTRWEAMVKAPESVPSVVEECLRIDGSVIAWYRTTAEAVEFAGKCLPKNAKVVMMLGAANHDESIYENPESFCPSRGLRNGHLTFSGARHYCLGAPLARMEMRIALEEAARRLPSLRLASPQRIEYEPSVATRLIKSLKVEWDSKPQKI
jgi:cytochrome P450